jgi:hypothetical protein
MSDNMKSIIIAFVLSAITAGNLSAQNQFPVYIGKEGNKTTYQQNGKYLTKKELAEALKSNAESINDYNESSVLGLTAGLFIIPGIISTCTGVVYACLSRVAFITGDKDQASKYQINGVITLLSGLGLTVIGGSIAGASNTHLTRSINNYNNTLKTGRAENAVIFVGFTGEGLGVRLRF